MQYDKTHASSSDVADFAEELLGYGAAVSENQARWIATILLDPTLCLEARLILVALAKKKGADFNPADLSADEIWRGVDAFDRANQAISLLLAEPAGRA
jgi:hypothetical protein